ncbi:MAG: GTP-binding protein [Candidatus Dojkabacteria bacterium]|nr:GTP-binding protein [Candidatus Dojkabacteria bacterium]
MPTTSNKTKITQDRIRNVAIIAHVDHGKTTLVDAFLKQNNVFRENEAEMQQHQILDSGELEREKGITIQAKNIAIRYRDHKINIIDTPGHSDFGGEVERTLNMADGCILLVDAQEGPMPQTKFVLKKAFELGLVIIVVINKIDKKLADINKTISRVQDLFLSLATEPKQLDFPVFYAIGREGKVFRTLPSGDLTVPNSTQGDVRPLLDEIIEYIPAPSGDPDGPFQMQICSLEYDSHQGRALIGKVKRGTVSINDPIALVRSEKDGGDGSGTVEKNGAVKRLMVREGLSFVETDYVISGDITAISGIDTTAIGATLCDPQHPDPLPEIHISDPSVEIKMEANTSPFVGKEGKLVTARLLHARLDREAETNISLRVRKGLDGAYYVAGRGELQLSILIETLRREGFEFQVRKPEVINKMIEGKEHEPQEELVIDAPDEYIGVITEELSVRKAQLTDMQSENGQTRFTYLILTRYLLGLRRVLLTATKGNVVMNSYVSAYVPFTDPGALPQKGSLISSETGTAMGYSLNTLQDRGMLFIKPGDEVYEGMVVGINKYDKDMEMNPTKARHQSAVRMKHDEITQTNLKHTMQLTLDYALSYLKDDEILEITPKNLRLRKALLTKTERQWKQRRTLSPIAEKSLREKGVI